MGIRLLLLCSFSICVQGQQDPKDVLAHVRDKVIGNLTRLPKYVCTEKIERAQYERGGLQARSCDAAIEIRDLPQSTLQKIVSDRMRLDVANGNGPEIFTWVGEQRSDDRALQDLIRLGPISNGGVASFLRTIFGSDGASVSY